MRAWMIETQTGVESLKLVEREKPVPGEGQVLVRMTAPGVVPFDSAVINDENEADFPPAALPIQPGNQGAGVIEDPGRSAFAKGERVMFGTFAYGFMRPGSWAEYVVVDEADLARIPDSVRDGAAAQAVVAYPTAYMALREAGFQVGKTVLATGIGGSVGNAAYQLARALGASKVLGTVGSADKARLSREAGFDNVIDLSAESMFAGTVKCVKRYGVIITLGFAGGRTSAITLADLILRRARIQGFGVYTSTPEEWRGAWGTFSRLADEGKINPLFDRSFPFEQAPEAVRYIIEGRPFGAVALSFGVR
jgi:NADPH2:quinone reductase